MSKPTTAQRLSMFVESEMAQGVDKATIAKALKAKHAELDKESRPTTADAGGGKAADDKK